MRSRDEDGEELDPRAAALVARLRRVLVVFLAVLAVGFITVMSVIVWQIVKSGRDVPRPQEARSSLTAPAGTRIVGTAATDRRLYVTLEGADGSRHIRVLDAATLREIGQITLQPAP